jgi:hypothetical protein
MKTLLSLAALFLALVPAALAADPGAALTADLQKLAADRATMHAAVTADLQKVTSDAQSGLSGSSLKPSIRSDVQKLKTDISSNHQVMAADRLQAARVAHVKLTQLRSQFQQLLQLWQTDYQQDLQAAQQAIASLEASSGK